MSSVTIYCSWFELSNLKTYFNSIELNMSKFYNNDKNNPYPSLDPRPNNEQPPKPSSNQKDIFERHQKPKNEGQGQGDLVFLKGAKEEKEQEKGCCDRCCSCLSIDYYKDFFKVNNKIVFQRMKTNLKFWSGGFFQDLKEDYDIYGPFWLYTTMVFVCSAIHNVLAYLENSTSFQYNFKIIGIGFGVFYVLGLLLSIVYGLLFGCLGLTTKTIHIVCLYGYGMTAYVICVLLCVLNMSLMTWLFLLYAAGTKVAYILRNIFELQVPTSKRVIIMILVIAEAGVQMLAIKFALLSNSGVPYSTATTSSTVQSHQAAYPLHMRTHQIGGL